MYNAYIRLWRQGSNSSHRPHWTSGTLIMQSFKSCLVLHE